MKLSSCAKRWCRIALAMILIGSATGSPPALAGTTITLGSGFNAPEGVAVDASGNVFVADTYNNAVKKILAAGGYTTVDPLGGSFNLPNSIAIDTSGNLWVIDIQNGVREILAPGYTTVNPIGVGTNHAQGIAVDASGNLFVADTGNHRVIEIPAAGGYATVNTLGSGFSQPTGVAVDGNGNVFVVDYLTSKVYEILKAGGYTTVNTLADLTNCNGIAVDASVNVYVACPFGIAKLLAPGYTAVNYIGSGFNHPYGVAVDARGNVFVADTYNYEVKEITAALPPTITTDFGAATIPLNGTTSLTFALANPNANAALTGVAFTDGLPAGLVVATPNGLTNTCGGTATAVAGASSANLAVNLAAGASCTMIVSVKGTTAGVKNNSVQVSSYNGGAGNTSNATLTVSTSAPTITNTFGAATIPVNGTTSLTFDLTAPNAGASQTGVAFTDSLPAGLVVATPNGLTNTCGGTGAAAAGSSSASLSGATLADGASCTLSVLVQGKTRGVKSNNVQVTSTNGGTGNTSNATLTVSLLSCTHDDSIFCKGFEPSTTVPLLTGINLLDSVTVDASGNVFLTDSFNNAVKEVLAPDYTTVKTLGSGFNHPTSVAVDASGNVYVADEGNNAVKQILAPAYTTVNTLGSGFSSPLGVAVDASGNVFVGDTGNTAVKQILKAGGYTTVNTIGSGFTHPQGVAVDALGNVFVADTYSDAVKQILAPGYTTVNTVGGGFNKPTGVAVDAGGNVFVADRFNDAVKEILAAGGYTVVFPIGSGFNSPLGVGVDSSGNVFVADSYNYAIKVIVK